MPEEPLNASFRPEKFAGLESALAALAPAPVGLDRDRLMYRCGQAAGRGAEDRRSWAWPALAAALAAISLTQAVLYHARPAAGPREADVARVEDRVEARVADPAASRPAAPRDVLAPHAPHDPVGELAGNSYLRLRQLALVQGIEALPAPGSHPGSGSASDGSAEPVWRWRGRHGRLGDEPRGS